MGGGSVLEGRLELLCDDKGTCHTVNIATLNGQVHLYVIHMVSEPQIIMLECFPPKGDCNKGGFLDEVHVEGEGDCDEEVHMEGQPEGVVEERAMVKKKFIWRVRVRLLWRERVAVKKKLMWIVSLRLLQRKRVSLRLLWRVRVSLRLLWRERVSLMLLWRGRRKDKMTLILLVGMSLKRMF